MESAKIDMIMGDVNNPTHRSQIRAFWAKNYREYVLIHYKDDKMKQCLIDFIERDKWKPLPEELVEYVTNAMILVDYHEYLELNKIINSGYFYYYFLRYAYQVEKNGCDEKEAAVSMLKLINTLYGYPGETKADYMIKAIHVGLTFINGYRLDINAHIVQVAHASILQMILLRFQKENIIQGRIYEKYKYEGDRDETGVIKEVNRYGMRYFAVVDSVYRGWVATQKDEVIGYYLGRDIRELRDIIYPYLKMGSWDDELSGKYNAVIDAYIPQFIQPAGRYG